MVRAFGFLFFYFPMLGPSADKLDYFFTAIVLVTVAIVVLELAMAIYLEMVASEDEKRHLSRMRETLMKFLGMVIIAVLIEELIMLLRFGEAVKIHYIPHAGLTFTEVFPLILGLSFCLKMTIPLEELIERKNEKK